MCQSEIAKWLKGITVVLALMGLVFFLVLMPLMAEDMADKNAELVILFWPGMLYGWCIAAVCYAMLYQFWKVCVEIGKDNSFSRENAVAFVHISRFAMILALLWFAGLVFLTVNGFVSLENGFFMILAMLVTVIIAIMAAALSHLILKAYEMRQENELTI